jgi:uncharacterized membrane protein YfcA
MKGDGFNMRRIAAIILVVLMILPLATAAFAGGPPPKNFKKGVFLEIDRVAGTALFQSSDSAGTMTLRLGEEIEADDITLNSKVMMTFEERDGQTFVKTAEVMFLDLTLSKFIALIVVGLIGGLLSGFIGSGGAFVLTPAMMSLGVPGAIAVASNMCHKFPKAMVGAYKRFKYGQVDIKLGLVMAVSAIAGVQIGIKIQKVILNAWGNAGSNLYVSLVFVITLVVVGGYVLRDAFKLSKSESDDTVSKFALKLQKINIPPMIHFKTAGFTLSAWITLPVGLATGMLAATIAVGGFIGVPGMIYVCGASAIVASATELLIAFVMGAWGSFQWALSGLVDIRLTLLILSASLIGVQLGALGTTYVKDYTIKLVMASVMLIVAVSRGVKIPGYLADLGLRSSLDPFMASLLNSVSFWSLVAALGTAAIIITAAMIKGMANAKQEEEVVSPREV